MSLPLNRLASLLVAVGAFLFVPRVAHGAVPSPDPVQITEFMAANQTTLKDQDGDYSDWIEIHNDGPSVNLDGWFLTTNPSGLQAWTFPRVTLLTNSRMVIFASGKNRAIATNELHTHFKLQRDGGYLALIRPDGTNVASAFIPAYPRQHEDVSFGRLRYIPEATGFFVRPSPGEENSDSGPGFAPDVFYSREGGLFTNAFDLELTSADPAAIIRYTTNGAPPTAGSLLYERPITVTNRTQVRARVFIEGLLPGPVRSEVYIYASPRLFQFTSNLPLLVLDTFGRIVPENGDLPAFVALYEPVEGRTTLTQPPTLRTRVSVDRRGSSTITQPKANYNVELWDEFNADKSVSLLGLPPESDFILHGPYNWDPSLIRNPLVYELSAQMGRYAPRYRFVEVFVNPTVNPLSTNHYAGVYNLLEKIKLDANRVDIDRLDPLDNQAEVVSGGYIVKVDRINPGDSGFTGGGVVMAYVEPQEIELKTPQRAPQKAWLTARLNSFGQILNRANYTDPIAGYRPWIDAPAWIDYHLLNTLSGNVDAFRLSTFLHLPRNGPITFGPVWDYDRSLGSTDGRDSTPRAWNAGSSDFFGFTWWSRVLRDPDFWQEWVDRWQELRTSTLSHTHVSGLIDELNAEILEASVRDSARWRQPKRGGSQAGEIRHLKNWISNRIDFIDTQFIPKPVPGFSADHELLLTSVPNAIIYTTLNGQDPREPGGKPRRHAQVFNGPQPLEEVAVVMARAFMTNPPQRLVSGGPPARSFWSGPLKLRVSPHRGPEPGELIVQELHFHPPPASEREAQALPGSSAEDFEFIELRNTSNSMLDLYGLRFTEGIHFEFSQADSPVLGPGSIAVLARNRQAFRARHGFVPQLAGTYSGRLANKGERIKLVDARGRTLLALEYSDIWIREADGEGPSLTLAFLESPPASWSTPLPWHGGKVWGGSPGYIEPEPWTPESLAEWKIRRFPAPTGQVPAEASDFADPDADGMPNIDEFHAGTNPMDRSDCLRIQTIVSDIEGIRIRFPVARGRSYQLLRRDLGGSSWSVLHVLPSVEATGLADVIDLQAPHFPSRLYRLAIAPR